LRERADERPEEVSFRTRMNMWKGRTNPAERSDVMMDWREEERK
jgi:hypothetical protein